MASKNQKVASHIGVILDGNRRFAKTLRLDPWRGHEYGAKKVEKFLGWARELDIREVTFYSLSMQNLNRPKREFDFLMKLFKKEFTRLLQDPRLMEDDVRIRVIGRFSVLPDELVQIFHQLMDKTKDNKSYMVNFAVGYGGREEIVDAVKKLSQDVKDGRVSPEDIDQNSFSSYLYMDSEPDLIIRTGGDKRTSNFLIWQSHYSEWFFIKKRWPEFEKEDLKEVVEQFENRERRFGR